MEDLISIVLPVYNGDQYLAESIDSIINQTYTNWELLILDDCSTDNTPNISKKYAELDERIKYYRNEKNLRLPGNLNRGFELSKGTYLTWTSDDNKFKPNALEKMLNKLKEDESKQLVYCDYDIIDENGNFKTYYTVDKKAKEHIVGNNVVCACFMYTRKVYDKVGDYDVDLMLVEDFDYWQRVLMNFDATTISESLYEYRVHSMSLTSTKKKDVFYQRLERMLKKNKDGFGKLSIEQNYFYYRCLCLQANNKELINRIKYMYYNTVYRILRKLG